MSCFDSCNKKFTTISPNRLYCKKGCDSDENVLYFLQNLVNILTFFRDKCKDETCGKVCIKEELGDEDSKLGSIYLIFNTKLFKGWSKFFARAPKDP